MGTNYDHKRVLTREAIEESDDISEQDRDLLLAFDEELALRQSEFASATRYKLLSYLSVMAGVSRGVPSDELPNVDLTAVLEDREVAEELVRWIHDRYDNEESNAGMRRVLRTFGRVMTDAGENGEAVPESLSWVSTQTSNTYDTTPSPGEMLSWQETLTLIDNVFNDRDAALIAVAWDSGARGEELSSLTVGDVTDHRLGLELTVQGKTGKRSVTLIPSVPYLQRWLAPDAHPAPDDPDAPLWCRLDSPDSVSYETLWKAVSRAGERADFDKTVNFTVFRKSSASYLASQGMSQAHLEEHHGWTRGSDVASRYVTVFGEAADNELAEIHGLEVDSDDTDPVGPVPCPRCDEPTPRERANCIHCNQALDMEAQELLDEVIDRFDERAITAEDPDERAELVNARRQVERNPGALDKQELHELLTSSKD